MQSAGSAISAGLQSAGSAISAAASSAATATAVGVASVAVSGAALGYATWELGVESLELESSLSQLEAAEAASAAVAVAIEAAKKKKEDTMRFFWHYRKDDITGQILWQGSHVTTSFFTTASEAKRATGAGSACWRCNVGGPSKAFLELAMTPGYATDYEVVLPGVVYTYSCTKLDP